MREGVSLRKKIENRFAIPNALQRHRRQCYVISNMALLMCLRRLKATVHGFRSSFRDWCVDNGVPRELAEAALVHTAASVERASHRSDVIDLRRDFMRRWANMIAPPVELEKVMPIKRRRETSRGRFLSIITDNTLFGPPAKVREGVTTRTCPTPILSPRSAESRYSTLMPVARITSPSLAYSVRTSAANASGVSPPGSAPNDANH